MRHAPLVLRDSILFDRSHTNHRLAAPTAKSLHVLLLGLGAAALFTGCEPAPEVRVYVAPKVESEFVSVPGLPKSDGTVQSSESTIPRIAPPKTARRMLGAVIPIKDGVYFIKATDSPETLESLVSAMHTVVERFDIDPATGLPKLELPEGWSVKPRNDIAFAEFNVTAAGVPVKFTVTRLEMPSAEGWNDYLLGNINRWRGQLALAPWSVEEMGSQLEKVARNGSELPGYLFDATGTGSGAMGGPASGQRPGPNALTPNLPNAVPPSAPASASSGAASKPPIAIKYETPESWQLAADRPFRLATFDVKTSAGTGEVAVSMAVNDPAQNTLMWQQQISSGAPEDQVKTLAEQVVANAEDIPAGKRTAKLYTIRASEQADAPTLLVAAIPMEQDNLSVFVKLKTDLRSSEEQKANFLKFVNSLSWE